MPFKALHVRAHVFFCALLVLIAGVVVPVQGQATVLGSVDLTGIEVSGSNVVTLAPPLTLGPGIVRQLRIQAVIEHYGNSFPSETVMRVTPPSGVPFNFSGLGGGLSGPGHGPVPIDVTINLPTTTSWSAEGTWEFGFFDIFRNNPGGVEYRIHNGTVSVLAFDTISGPAIMQGAGDVTNGTTTVTAESPITPIVATAQDGTGSATYAIAPALHAGLQFDTATGTISGTPETGESDQVHTITASDPTGETSATVRIRVEYAPLTVGLSASSVTLTSGEPMTDITANVTGGDGNPTFSITPALPAGLEFDTETGTISGTPTEGGTTSTHAVMAFGSTGPAAVGVTITVNYAPLDLELSASSVTLTSGEPMTDITATLTGGDGNPTFAIAPALPAGLEFDTTTGTISGTPTAGGTSDLYAISVTDGTGFIGALLTIAVDYAPLDLDLSASTAALTRGVAMTAVTATATGGDEEYSFTIAPSLPAGLSIDADSGAISGTPTETSATTSYTVIVADGEGATATASLSLGVDHPALDLVLSEASVSLTRGAAMTAVTATAEGGDEEYSFSIAPSLPAGLSIDADSGAISGTPSAASSTTSYTITVADGEGATATASLTLGVDHPALDLDLSSGTATLTRGVAMTAVTATAEGGDGAYSFTIAPALPAGLSIDADSGAISGTPSAASSTTSYTVTVADGEGATATASLSLGVDHPALDLVLSEASVSLTRGAAMTAVTATAEGGDEEYTFSIAPSLPAGLSIDADSGAISGTPSAASSTTSYTITVADGEGATATASLTLGVDHPALDLDLSSGTATLTRGVAMTAVTATAEGGDGAYSFTIAPALPAGLSIDADSGAISGTPSAASSTTSYTVTVADGEGATATASLSLGVDHPALDLDLSSGTATLTRGVAMTDVTATATGGDEDYTFSIAPSLPAGLSINVSNGTISGTPTVSATTTGYTVRVTDGEGATATATLSLGVDEDEMLIIDTFTEATSAFIMNRMDRILSMEPRGYRFSNRRAQNMREIVGRGDDDAAMFRFGGNYVSPNHAWHVWTEGEISGFRHGRHTASATSGHFGMLSMGGDYLLNPSLAVGMMAQFDLTSERRPELADISGWGWMVGPYISGEISPDLFFTLRGAVGGSRNSASLDVYQDGSAWFDADFSTRRALVRGSIYGFHRFESGLVLSPELDLAWMRERQRDYMAQDGSAAVLVPGTVAEVGRLTLSTLVESPLRNPSATAFLRPGLIWNFASTGRVQPVEVMGSLEMGLRVGGAGDWNALGAIRFDGLGSRQQSAWALRLNMSRQF